MGLRAGWGWMGDSEGACWMHLVLQQELTCDAKHAHQLHRDAQAEAEHADDVPPFLAPFLQWGQGGEAQGHLLLGA